MVNTAVNKLVNPQLPVPKPPPLPHNHLKDHEKRIEDELKQLVVDVRRIGNPDEPHCLFGQLFDDDEVQQYYEALVGTLKSAKKRGIITFRGQMLLKGMHDNVKIELVESESVVPSLTESKSLSSEQQDATTNNMDATIETTAKPDASLAPPPAIKRTPPRWMKKSVAPETKEASVSTTKGATVNRTPPRWTKKSMPTETTDAPSEQRTTTPPRSRDITLPMQVQQTPPRPSAGFRSLPTTPYQTPPRPPSSSSYCTPKSVGAVPSVSEGRHPLRKRHNSLKIPDIFTCSDDSDGESKYKSPHRITKPIGRISPCGAWSDSETVVTRRARQRQQQQEKEELLDAASEHSPRIKVRRAISERWTRLFSNEDAEEKGSNQQPGAKKGSRRKLVEEKDDKEPNTGNNTGEEKQEHGTLPRKPNTHNEERDAIAPLIRSQPPKFRASLGSSKAALSKQTANKNDPSRLARAESERVLPSSTKPQSSFVRVDEEVQQLLSDIHRLSSSNEKPTRVSFGDLFNDDVVQNTYEALVGTLRSAKRKGLVKFKGQVLLKGVHDEVMIEIV